MTLVHWITRPFWGMNALFCLCWLDIKLHVHVVNNLATRHCVKYSVLVLWVSTLYFTWMSSGSVIVVFKINYSKCHLQWFGNVQLQVTQMNWWICEKVTFVWFFFVWPRPSEIQIEYESSTACCCNVILPLIVCWFWIQNSKFDSNVMTFYNGKLNFLPEEINFFSFCINQFRA